MKTVCLRVSMSPENDPHGGSHIQSSTSSATDQLNGVELDVNGGACGIADITAFRLVDLGKGVKKIIQNVNFLQIGVESPPPSP